MDGWIQCCLPIKLIMPIQNIFESIRPEFIFSSDTPRQAQMKPSSQYMY